MRLIPSCLMLLVGLMFFLSSCKHHKDEIHPAVSKNPPSVSHPRANKKNPSSQRSPELHTEPEPTLTELSDWEKIGVDAGLVEEQFFNSDWCAENLTQFSSCMYGINALLMRIPINPMVLLPESLEKVVLPSGYLLDLRKYVPALSDAELLLALASFVTETHSSFDHARFFSIIDLRESGDSESFKQLQTRYFRLLTLEVWKRAFQTETLNLDFGKILEAVKKEVEKHPTEKTYLWVTALNAHLTPLYDDHSRFKPIATLQRDLKNDNSKVYSGIGIHLLLTDQQKLLVKDIIPNGPAAAVGLKPFDSLIQIDGMDVSEMNLGVIEAKIQGAENSKVQLLMERGEERFLVELTRQRIAIPVVQSEIFSMNGKKVGYIKLSTFFNRNLCTLTRESIEELKQQSVSSFVLDLRGNGGGLLEQAVCVADLFLPEGQTVTSQKFLKEEFRSMGTNERLVCDSREEICKWKTIEPALTDLPLIVLQDYESASASELLAGALQSLGRAYIAGERSFGKGSFQVISSYWDIDGVALFKTSGYFLQPDGSSNQLVGITPDFLAPSEPTLSPERFLPRETWQTINPLPNIFPNRRGEISLKIQACVSESVKNRSLYLNPAAAKPFDYPMLAVGDLLDCVN